MKWDDVGEMPCSVARSLAIVGDRWTMLIIRNAFLGVRRFENFQTTLGVTRHVLAERLARLVEAGILRKQAYQQGPERHEYRLTAKGKDLHSVVLALVAFGDRWLDEGKGAPLVYHHKSCGKATRPTLVCSECAEPLQARDVTAMAGPGLQPRSR